MECFSARQTALAGAQRKSSQRQEISSLDSACRPAYHILNLRVYKRFNFRHSDPVVFVDIWNVCNRQNVDHYTRTKNGEIGVVSRWGLVPVCGLEWDF